MKTKFMMLLMALCLSSLADAKDIRKVVFKTNPEMHCANCENRIKNNLRFEKGVKDIQTDLKTKEVTVKYDADKTTVENLIAGFEKIKYRATLVEKKDQAEADAVDSISGSTQKMEGPVGQEMVWFNQKDIMSSVLS